METILKLEKVIWRAGESFRISDIDLEIEPGRSVVLSGSPEAGRSLLLKLIGGIYTPDEGRILFRGTDIHGEDEEQVKEARKKIAFGFERGVHLSNIIIRENLLLPLKFYYHDFNQREAGRMIREYMEYFSLGDLLDKRPAEVSEIKKKLLGLIRALIMQPDLLLLDEPLFNLDMRNQKLVIELLKKLKSGGMTIIIVCNSIDILKAVADILVVMENGSITEILEKNDPEFLKVADRLEFIDLAGVEDEI